MSNNQKSYFFVELKLSRQARPLDFVIASVSSFFCCVVSFYAVALFEAMSFGSFQTLSGLIEWLAETKSLLWLDLTACAAAAPIAWTCSRIGVFTFPASLILGCMIGLAAYFSYFGTELSGVFPPPPVIAAIYGASASTVFFITLGLRRPTAFHKRWRDRGLRVALLLCATPPMLHANWMRFEGLFWFSPP